MIGSFLVCSLPRSACSNTVSVDGVTSASRLLLAGIIFYINVAETQIADANTALLCCVCCVAYVPAVHVPFVCSHMGRPVSRSKSIHLSLCIPPSVSFIYLFMLLGPCLKQLVGACTCIWLQPLWKSQFALQAISSAAAAVKFRPRTKRGGN